MRRCDGLADEAGRGGAGVLHLRSSRDQVAGDLLERRALHQRHCPRDDARVRRSRRQCCRGIERIRASRSRCGIFPTGRVVSVLWGGEAAGSKWGSVRPEARPGGGTKSEGRKGRERVAGKAAGDERVFIPGEGPTWQMRPAPTPCRTRRAVRAVTGSLNRIA
jgi:hypothetical protein